MLVTTGSTILFTLPNGAEVIGGDVDSVTTFVLRSNLLRSRSKRQIRDDCRPNERLTSKRDVCVWNSKHQSHCTLLSCHSISLD